MPRKHEDIPLALDAALSGADRDPALFNRVVNASKGELPPVKRKLTLSMALVLILVLVTGTVAVAAACRGVTYFLEQRTWDPISIDPDYLLTDLRQNHTSEHLNISVVDTYWDGREFFLAYHISPIDAEKSLRMECRYPHHIHYEPVEAADIMLREPDRLISTNDSTGDVSPLPAPRENALFEYSSFSDWVYEEDGSLTVMVKCQLYSMEGVDGITIPVYYTMDGKSMESYLHCYPPTLSDPIAAHEHKWAPAICVAPKTCTICQRTEGGLGFHDFRPTEDSSITICSVCESSSARPDCDPRHLILSPGDYTNHVWEMQYRLYELGHYSGLLSARYDEETMAAVKSFQESQGLEANGICDRETLQKLFP